MAPPQAQDLGNSLGNFATVTVSNDSGNVYLNFSDRRVCGGRKKRQHGEHYRHSVCLGARQQQHHQLSVLHLFPILPAGLPAGNNPGAYLHANFAAAFPGGLMVGCSPSYNITLTSAQAITNLLPTGGTPAVLKSNYTNPASIKNELVGQVVSLSLSVGFDIYDPSFGPATIALGDMKIGSGTFAGWTVKDFLAEANKVLGGCDTTYTPQQIEDTIDKINKNYDDGTVNQGFLVCPN